MTGLDDVIDSIDSDVINDVIENKMETVKMNLRMPEFTFRNNFQMEEILAEMGITKMFTMSQDFLTKMLQDDSHHYQGLWENVSVKKFLLE